MAKIIISEKNYTKEENETTEKDYIGDDYFCISVYFFCSFFNFVMSIVKHIQQTHTRSIETKIIDFVTNLFGLVYLISCETTTINGLYLYKYAFTLYGQTDYRSRQSYVQVNSVKYSKLYVVRWPSAPFIIFMKTNNDELSVPIGMPFIYMQREKCRKNLRKKSHTRRQQRRENAMFIQFKWRIRLSWSVFATW